MKQSQNRANKWEDHYTRKARLEKYPARSVYKLQEIQQKYKLLKKGDKVLDLGCAPGSWLLYAAKEVGESGKVIGMDLKPLEIQLPTNATAYEADIFSEEGLGFLSEDVKFDVVMSDMAPSTTGNKHVDSARSYNLCEAAFFVAQKTLATGGVFICKIFQGEDFDRFMTLLKTGFAKYKLYKPQSTRKASKEIYVIGIDRKAASIETIDTK